MQTNLYKTPGNVNDISARIKGSPVKVLYGIKYIYYIVLNN